MKKKYFYEFTMAILAIISIVLIVLSYLGNIDLSRPPYSFVDNGILIILAIDYFVRLIIAKDKKKFFINNIFDLLAIIPVNNLFYFFRFARVGRAFQLVRLLRVLRLVGLTGRLKEFLHVNGLLYYLYLSLAVILVTSALFCIAEKIPFMTAFWWSISTSTTVGYGDISPHTALGKFAAIIDMSIGIGLIGMLTSSITNVFSRSNHDDLHAELAKVKKQNKEILAQLNKIEKQLNK
ncbi:potassium channel family protein [Limosilactobacillus caecicola]|uniref:potassium channel family protein n=1 Tax=Limosilactobacillus caecicola TaxID=2941332 RepID=UPI00203C5FA8|nr:potassium channel family protein [Limosilactobacillus caecicola]